MSEPAPARQVAFDALGDRKDMPSHRLDRLLSERDLTAGDAALARELVLGVTRRRRTLDALIRTYSDRPKRQISPAVRQALRLGLYQLLFTDRVPDFAAVNESVELVRRKQPRQAGFVNAVLRAASRGMGPADDLPPAPGVNVVTVSPGRGRVMDKAFLPDPAEQPEQHLGVACSLPDDLAERWYLRKRRNLAEAMALGLQTLARPSVIARVNLARTTVAAVLEELAGASVAAEAHANGKSVVLLEPAELTQLACFADGRITVQDPTATQVGLQADVAPGMRVLDFCSAPGTKTTHLAELMRGEGEIVAVDVSEEKLARVRESARRCGYENMVRTLSTERAGSLPPGGFDRVLVDAPCTNTGVLARRVEARWNFTNEALKSIAADQRTILSVAAMFCSGAGKLIYSTCSIEPEENDKNVRAFLRRRGGFRIERDRGAEPVGWAGPQHYRDGGYWAVLAAD